MERKRHVVCASNLELKADSVVVDVHLDNIIECHLGLWKRHSKLLQILQNLSMPKLMATTEMC